MSDPGVEVGARARILDGRALAKEILAETAGRLEALRDAHGRVPGIRILMIGEDPASRIYARRIVKTAEKVGASGVLVELPGDTPLERIRGTLRDFSADEDVGGVIMQLPLPEPLQPRGLIEALDPLKDLDGIHPFNAGLISRGSMGFAPSCAEAALQILRRSGIPVAGRPAVVVGRSNVVGRPVQLLLLREDATVTVCHRQTRDLASHIRAAEIVVAAAGSPGLIDGSAVREEAVVIDCGINVLADGTLVGDVDLETVAPRASALTPVPGGVGPVTNAVLMEHLARAIEAQRAGDFADATGLAS